MNKLIVFKLSSYLQVEDVTEEVRLVDYRPLQPLARCSADGGHVCRHLRFCPDLYVDLLSWRACCHYHGPGSTVYELYLVSYNEGIWHSICDDYAIPPAVQWDGGEVSPPAEERAARAWLLCYMGDRVTIVDARATLCAA